MDNDRYPPSHHRDKKAEREVARKSRQANTAAYALERSLVRPDGSKAPVPAAIIGSPYSRHLRLYPDSIVMVNSIARKNEQRERPHYLSDLREIQWATSGKGRSFIRLPSSRSEIHLDISSDPSAIQCTQSELDDGLKALHDLYPSLPAQQIPVLGELISSFTWGTARGLDDKNVQAALNLVPGFKASNHITGINGVALALDSAQHKLCVINARNWTCRVYEAASLISVEVFEDGQSIARSHRHGKTGRGMVAVGLLVGDFATLASGLAAGNAAKPRDLIHEVAIRVGINDPEHPICDVPLFVSRSQPIKRGSSWYRSVSTEARSWASLLTAMTEASDLAESGSNQHAGPPAPAPGMSVAAELGQIAKLYSDGHLTDAEFAELKSRLIKG
jgi:hypothetical protein